MGARRMYEIGASRLVLDGGEWYDGEIVPGQPGAQEISRRMDAAEIILLLITPPFLG